MVDLRRGRLLGGWDRGPRSSEGLRLWRRTVFDFHRGRKMLDVAVVVVEGSGWVVMRDRWVLRWGGERCSR